ncbi:hypothetical protein [Natronorubrum sp. FCH18a]|uniref:hypothetical protein n=1 Tax=Natronorubrum sp. FCH18a TaxID=3447018 RepID=UPI003F513DFA
MQSASSCRGLSTASRPAQFRAQSPVSSDLDATRAGQRSVPIERTIDAEGNYLIPGFICPHNHMGISRYEHD